MLFIKSLGQLAYYSVIRTTTTLSKTAAATINTNSNNNISSSNDNTNIVTNNQQQDNQSNSISIKESCLNRLKQIIDKPREEFLRVQVETGGCSGFSYVFNIENNDTIAESEDLIFHKEQYRVIVSKDILPYIEGSSIEFNESLIKSSFQIVNPIAETKCSCGTSFSVDLSKLNKSKSSTDEKK